MVDLSEVDFDELEGETTIDRFLNNEDELRELFRHMLTMPERANEAMVESRREELFRVLWKETDMTEKQVLELVQEREQDCLDKYSHIELPEWLLRMEAQDMLLKAINHKFREEGLI